MAENKDYKTAKNNAADAILNSRVMHMAMSDRDRSETEEEYIKLNYIKKVYSDKKVDGLEKMVISAENTPDVDLTVKDDYDKNYNKINSVMAAFSKDGDMSLHTPKGKSQILDNTRVEGKKQTVTPGENTVFYKKVEHGNLNKDAEKILKKEKKKLNILEDFDFELLEDFSNSPSGKYTEYVENHIENVQKAYNFLKNNCPEIFKNLEINIDELDKQIKAHDKSKYSPEEFIAYADHFYGSKNNDEEYKKAWEHHYSNNPHHPEYWGKENEMPISCIIEMLCDWWSFSWDKNKLNEIFKWWEENKAEKEKYLNEKSEKILEKFLAILKDKIKE